MAGKFCFTHPSGKDIYLYTLRNENGAEVEITNYGAIILKYILPMPDGSRNDIVLGFDNAEDYLTVDYLQKCPYMGAAIGRYANRIGQGSFSIDEEKFHVTKNGKGFHLHGGMDGFDKKVWDFISLDESCNILELKYRSADGEEGYPGNLDVHLTFELNEDNDLLYTFTAVTDKKTPVNLTHHSYFNLGNGEGKLKDHQLKIYADKILEQDKDFIATGNFIPVDNTKYDFQEFKPVDGNDIAEKTYDQSFDLGAEGDHFSIAAELMYEPTGLKLQLLTTEPIVHFYTGFAFPELPGKNGVKYGPFAGIALETQRHPNAVNIPKFPNTILAPGEKYVHRTAYKICMPSVNP
jgi:aldose 1-epimerase